MQIVDTVKGIDVDDDDQFLTADDVFGAEDLSISTMDVPEWKKNGKPGKLRFRTMTANESIQFQKDIKGQYKDEAWVRILALCAVKPTADGGYARMFSDKDMVKLREKNTSVFLRAQGFLLELNGFGQKSVDTAKND